MEENWSDNKKIWILNEELDYSLRTLSESKARYDKWTREAQAALDECRTYWTPPDYKIPSQKKQNFEALRMRVELEGKAIFNTALEVAEKYNNRKNFKAHGR